MGNFIKIWFRKLLKEWLLIMVAIGLVVTSFYLKRLPSYNIRDAEIIYILFVLLIIIKGLEGSGFFIYIAHLLENKRFILFYMITVTMILSMFVTNDIALLLMIPVTLSLNSDQKELLIILETLAANTGSALTPFGNPQNLFIYWFYHLHPVEFIKVIMPFTIAFFILLSTISIFIRIKNSTSILENRISKKNFLYLSFLFIFILSVLRMIPLWIDVLIIGYAIILDRDLFRIDYLLLGIFFCFFGLTDNLLQIIRIRIEDPVHVFMCSAFLSQIISNIPSALLFCDFTQNWRALLWGVNVGGLGNLIGSLASLIAYRFVVVNKLNSKSFILGFHIIGYVAFGIGFILYFALINL